MLSRVLKGGDYFRNAVTLISGTTISQVIPLIFAPILARIYPPENYGTLGVIMAITTLLGIIATFQYSSAIVLADTDKEAHNILYSCLIFSLGISLITLLVLLLLNHQVANLLGAPDTAKWLLFTPLSVLFVGVNASLSAFTNRSKQYKLLATNRVVTALLTAVVSLATGLAIKGETGLVAGYIAGQCMGTIFLSFSLRKKLSDIYHSGDLSIAESKAVLKKYNSFPKYVLFSEFINNFTNYIPVFLLSWLSGAATVGLYNMSTRMLGIPILTVSSAIGEVFRQKAAREYNETGSCKPTFLKTFKVLSLMSVIPFIVLIFWGGDIFGFIFGERWRQAGVFAQILGLMFFFRFLVSPLTYVYYVAGRQKEDFFLHLLMLVLGFGSIISANYFYGTEEKMLLFYSLAYSLIYLIYFIRSLSFTEKK